MVFPFSPAVFVVVHLCRFPNTFTLHLLGDFSGFQRTDPQGASQSPAAVRESRLKADSLLRQSEGLSFTEQSASLAPPTP